jgi:hypothetical protein
LKNFICNFIFSECPLGNVIYFYSSGPKLWKPSPEDKAAYMSELEKRALETEKKLEREVWRAKVEAEKLLNRDKRVQEARGGKGLMIGRMPFLNRKRDQVKKG